MNNSHRNHLLVSATPLLALAVLVILFVVPVTRYVECSRGNCASIITNLTRVLAADDPWSRTPITTDDDQARQKKLIKARERTALIYSGRLNFLFLLMIYLSVCVFAFVVGCYVIWKSIAHANIRPLRWVVAAIAISIGAGVFLYGNPQYYLRIFVPLINATIREDLPATEQLLVLVNSFGFAVALLLTLASCATLYPRNAGTYPEGLKQIAVQMKHLRLVLYVGTFMLVSGVLLIRSVYQWSLAFGLREAEAVKAAEGFFAVLLAVEGGYFTLLLAAVYVPAAFILRHRADFLTGLPQPEAEKEKELQNYNLSFSFMQSLPRIAAILGPLLAGPVGELFSRLG